MRILKRLYSHNRDAFLRVTKLTQTKSKLIEDYYQQAAEQQQLLVSERLEVIDTTIRPFRDERNNLFLRVHGIRSRPQ